MDRNFFVKNRARLAEELPENALAIFFGGEALRKTADENYPFFANRNFLYLTGIEQEQSILLLEKKADLLHQRLYILPKDDHKEIWNGRRLSPEEATAISGVEAVSNCDDFQGDLHGELSAMSKVTVYLCLDGLAPEQPQDIEHRFAALLAKRYPQVQIANAYPLLCSQRRIKQCEELSAIRKAMTLTEQGIKRMMSCCRPGIMEYQLEGEFLHTLAMAGQRAPAFPSIVASGVRNFYLHYPLPLSQIEDGDLVLTDVGAASEGYCTDVSRVFPANGRFTGRQADLYRVALEANRAIMDAVKPGLPFGETDAICRRVSAEGLRTLGLLSDHSDIGKYVWHKTTHHVGLNTHDVGGYTLPMSENMVVTVDAGIYVREWGIGLRVEDTVLVTSSGCENLSAAIPSEIRDIEALMGKA